MLLGARSYSRHRAVFSERGRQDPILSELTGVCLLYHSVTVVIEILHGRVIQLCYIASEAR